ncbi:MAG: tetratricopeptide repeat protein [Bacteroidales bacterium]|nr:tetratricopeptide repeat protein [Bacteroidales bacterium]
MAIEYALKSNEAGKKWLGIENIKNPDKNDLSYISGSYFRIYNAYKSLANNKFRNKNIKEALDNYIVAHDYLTACNPDSEYWQEEISWSLNSIGICYTSLKDYEKADSVFLLAINNYEKLNNPSEELLLYLLRNTAISLFEQREYDYSTELFKSANYILLKDPLNHDNKEMLISNYNYISVNSISQDKLSDAMINVEEALLLGNKEEKSYCLSTLYYGLIYCKLDQYYKADSILKESLDCYKAISESNNQDIAECYLALSRINISLAKYKNAEKYLNLGIEITKNNYGTKSSRYANYLKTLAQLNKITGNYNSAEKQCYEVIDIYTKELGANNNKLPEILLELAELETILSKPNLAKMHSDNSLFIMNEYDTVLTPTYSIFFNNVAYIDYYTRFYNSADSLYRKVIEINYNFGLYNNTTIANALNGMGLLETKKRNYIKADSLFNESLKILKKIFIDSHPSIANIYLNKGVLFTLQGKLTEAEVFIKQAFEINNHFFEKDHDIFADIYVALGDIKKIGHHNETAKDYYRQALEIYKKHFDDKHLKIISVKNKIQN